MATCRYQLLLARSSTILRIWWAKGTVYFMKVWARSGTIRERQSRGVSPHTPKSETENEGKGDGTRKGEGRKTHSWAWKPGRILHPTLRFRRQRNRPSCRSSWIGWASWRPANAEVASKTKTGKRRRERERKDQPWGLVQLDRRSVWLGEKQNRTYHASSLVHNVLLTLAVRGLAALSVVGEELLSFRDGHPDLSDATRREKSESGEEYGGKARRGRE
jgi:hypothetical protein